MKKILITLFILLISLSVFGQIDEFDDVYYQQNNDIQYDTTKINNNTLLLVNQDLNLNVKSGNFNSLSSYQKHMLLINVLEDFYWNPHEYLGSYLWKLRYNRHISYFDYMDWYWNWNWEWNFYYGTYYTNWLYPNYFTYNYYNYNNNYHYNLRPFNPYKQHKKINVDEKPIRQRQVTTTSNYVNENRRSTYTKTSPVIRQSNRNDHRVSSRVLPESNVERYNRPRSSSNIRSDNRTYDRNNNQRSSATVRSGSNYSRSSTNIRSSNQNTNRRSTTSVRSSGSSNRSSGARSGGGSGTSGSSRGGGRR